MADFGWQVAEINATAARRASARRLKKLKKKVSKEARTLRRNDRIRARVARERQEGNMSDLMHRVDVLEQQLRVLRRDDDEGDDDDDPVGWTEEDSMADVGAAAASHALQLEDAPDAACEQEGVFLSIAPPTDTGLVFTMSQGWVLPEDVIPESEADLA